MTIDFSPARWEKIKEDARLWWAGELERPLIQVRLAGRDPGGPAPSLPAQDFDSFHDVSVSADRIVARWEYDLSRVAYRGDAFPCRRPNFGPALIAGFLGVPPENVAGTTWYDAPEKKPLRALRFEFDPDNALFKRVKELCRAASERFDGRVQISLPDLAHPLDILPVFRPTGELLCDLYDDPETVERVIWNLHDLWGRYIDEFTAVLQPANPGYTGWEMIFPGSPTTSPSATSPTWSAPRCSGGSCGPNSRRATRAWSTPSTTSTARASCRVLMRCSPWRA